MGEKKVERPRGGPLTLEHEATRYANALVCRRCGQDWPCTFSLGIPIKDRIAAEQEGPEWEPEPTLESEPEPTPGQTIRLAWSRTGLTVTHGW